MIHVPLAGIAELDTEQKICPTIGNDGEAGRIRGLQNLPIRKRLGGLRWFRRWGIDFGWLGINGRRRSGFGRLRWGGSFRAAAEDNQQQK